MGRQADARRQGRRVARQIASRSRPGPGMSTGRAWLSDRTRPFVLVLAEAAAVENPMGPFAHLGVACASREEIQQLCAMAKSEGCLRDTPRETGGPAGYLAMLTDPDGHTLELSYGQEVGLTVERST